ncbi:MAG: hypothetical protein ACLQVN_16120 [Bryobacteraceae bacterium]
MFALEELDPTFMNKAVYMVTKRDGKPLTDKDRPFDLQYTVLRAASLLAPSDQPTEWLRRSGRPGNRGSCLHPAILEQVTLPAWLVVSDPRLTPRVRPLLRRLPDMDGAPIRIETKRNLRDRHGPVHAAAFLRERRMVFDCAWAEFPRIFVHELFHFVWLRLGNPLRHEWEDCLAAEFRAGVRGELGWSAEWRKRGLDAGEIAARGRRWREYGCEGFCDTAAWLYSGTARHAEFTLPKRWRKARAAWFESRLAGRELSI